jgi:glycosyltransferase involved in cell wall biosynthesis
MNMTSTKASSLSTLLSRMPTVSVVIPAYNAKEFLGEALDSVLAQTYQPLEVIVVDDGSADETPQVVGPYAGKVTYMRKERGGPASARNAGIRAARGEWIAFLDADDVWMPGFLEKLLGCCAQTDAGLVFCDSLIVRDGCVEGGTCFERCCLKSRLGTAARGGVLLHPLELLIELDHFIFTGAFLVRRDALTQIGLYDEALYCAEDMDLLMRLSVRFRFAVVDHALVLRRIHTKNISSNRWKTVTGVVNAFEKVEHYASGNATGTRWRKVLQKRMARFLRAQGVLQVARGELVSARKTWERSLQSSFTPTVAACWFASFLPQSWLEVLSNWQRRIKHEPPIPEFMNRRNFKKQIPG